ncbi:MAG: hypothetical protein M3P48_04735 [Actinomycetota bacterium]|nr:hypothetical protein [Actinomycetota bacterium]
MRPGSRRLALTAHVTVSVGWGGAVAAFLALAVTGLLTAEAARGAYLALEVVATYVIVPLAVATLASGVVSSVTTAWGLFRHYWVVVKLGVTVVAVVVLLLQLPLIAYLADAARAAAPFDEKAGEARRSLVVHSGAGLLVLLVPTVLGVYKPRGLTPYGARTARTARSG